MLYKLKYNNEIGRKITKVKMNLSGHETTY